MALKSKWQKFSVEKLNCFTTYFVKSSLKVKISFSKIFVTTNKPKTKYKVKLKSNNLKLKYKVNSLENFF